MSESVLNLLIKATDGASGVIGKIRGEVEKLEKATKNLAKDGFEKIQSAGKTMVTGLMIGIPLLGGLLGGLGLQSIKTSASYETLKVALETSLGSQEAAAKGFEQITTFAAATPFQLDEVAGAFIKLKNLGLDPSERALTSYGDTASAMGKGLNDMVEAVADAATGEFERLKEFGIRASSEGDNVKFTFKGVTTTVGKNSKEIEGYLIKLGETNFSGGMKKQSETLAGKLSTLKDTFSLTMAAFADDSGLSEWAKKGIDAASKLMGGVKPLYDLLVKGDYSDGLYGAFGWAEDSEIVIKILDIRDGVKDLTQKLKDFAQNSEVSKFIQDFVRDSDKMWSILVGISAALGAGIIAGFVSLGVAVLMAAWPFLLIAGLVGGLFYLFQTNESVRNFLTNVWNKLVEGFNYLKDVVLPQLITLWETKLQPMMAFLGQLIMTQLWPALQELWGKLMELWVLIEPYVIPTLQFLAVVLGVALYISIVWLIAALTLLVKCLSWMVDQWKRQVVEFNERWDRAKDAIEFFKNKGMDAFARVQHGISVMSEVVKNKIGEIVNNVNGAITSFNNLGNAIEKASGGAINVTDVSTISAPGRASGGKVEAGNLYEVGENNKAELFKMGNRQYMIPGNNGDVLNQSQIPIQSTSGGQKTTINLTFAPVVHGSNMDEQSLFEMFENWLAEKNLLTSLTGV
jgi:hypothetical protein